MYQDTPHPETGSREKQGISEAEIALRRILKSAPQDLWLDTIRRTKDAQHDTLVHWMLGQTECDFAIAVHAFYRSNPVQQIKQVQALPARPGPHDIFAQILLNWDTGSYRAHRLQVQTIDAHPRLIVRLNDAIAAQHGSTMPFAIPHQFLNPSGGKPLHLPAHQSPKDAAHLWPVYHALGLDVPPSPPGVKRLGARVQAAMARLGFRGKTGDA